MLTTWDLFGSAVAMDGELAVVGAQYDGDAAYRAGAVYVYRNLSGVWVEDGKLFASDAAAEARFGKSVAVSGDVVLVGAWTDSEGGDDAGAAYVFRHVADDWIEEQKLTATDAAEGDLFGGSVSIDGDRALIGAARDDDAGSNSGAAYVYRFETGSWIEETKLAAADGAASDLFGTNVSLSGSNAVISSHGDDDDGIGSGSAYVFRDEESGWVEGQKLTASDAAGGDLFGTAVASSGNSILIGAIGDDEAGQGAGAVYVFRESGGVWSEEEKLSARNTRAGDLFGSALALDGDCAVIGAPSRSRFGPSAGTGYVFEFDGESWVERQKMLVPSDVSSWDQFGSSVAVSGDAILAGTDLDDVPGAAYAFALPVNTEVLSLDPANGSAAGGTLVTVSGAGFEEGMEVRFDGVPSPSVTFLDGNQILVVTPPYTGEFPSPWIVPMAGASKGAAVNVRVLNGDCRSTLAHGFTYLPELR